MVIKIFKQLNLGPNKMGTLVVLPSEAKPLHLMPQQAFQQPFLLDQLNYLLLISSLIFQIMYVLYLFIRNSLRKSTRSVSLFSKVRTLVNMFPNCRTDIRALVLLPSFSIGPLSRKKRHYLHVFLGILSTALLIVSSSQSAP